jgi:thiol-disulfide isomerase/thioredoxin
MEPTAQRCRRTARGLAHAAAALVCLGALTDAPGQLPRAIAPGQAAPALVGEIHPSWSEFSADWSAHRVTLVNFWATWCEPCRQEMRQLQELYTHSRDRGLQIVGVFEAAETDKVAEFLKEVPVSYPLVGIGPRVDRAWGGIGIKPTSFLVDAAGRVLRRYVGAAPEQTRGLIADVESALDGRPLGPLVLPEAPKPAAPPAPGSGAP